MPKINALLVNNQKWAKKMILNREEYFSKLAEGQNPEYLWIGCSDSRVPAETLTGVEPGQIFVHRNVANLVVHTDLNCLSVVNYAVDILKIKYIIICGHTNCGGINTVIDNASGHGVIDNWLLHLKDLYNKHASLLMSLTPEHRREMLVRLNVAEQVYNLGRSTIIQEAWARGQEISIHGFVYDVNDGIILPQSFRVDDPKKLLADYQKEINRLVNLTDEALDIEHEKNLSSLRNSSAFRSGK